MKNTDYQILISQDNEPKIFTDILPPVKDHIPIEEPGDISPPKLLSNFYTGTVLDKTNGEPVQGASVYLYSGDNPIAGQQTNNKGFFQFDTDVDANNIRISHASYKPIAVKASIYNNSNFYIAELQRDEKILPPVELPGGTPAKFSYWWLLIPAAIIANEATKKKVGKIDMSTLLVIGAGGVMLLGFDTIKKMLESIGLWDDADTKDFDNQIENPDSFWNPVFWQRGPDGTIVLTHDFCTWLYNEIYDSFGIFDDDESRIYAAFKRLKTQSQLSYFSYWVQKNKNTDLLEWLKGGKYGPVGDHLSVKEIAIITDYFKGLPKYKA